MPMTVLRDLLGLLCALACALCTVAVLAVML
jgi:hypothetical protein